MINELVLKSQKLVWQQKTCLKAKNCKKKKTEQFEKRIEITDQHLKIHEKNEFSLKIHQKGRNCIHSDDETTTIAIPFRAPEQFFSYTWLTFLRRVIHVGRSCKIWPFFKKKTTQNVRSFFRTHRKIKQKKKNHILVQWRRGKA